MGFGIKRDRLFHNFRARGSGNQKPYRNVDRRIIRHFNCDMFGRERLVTFRGFKIVKGSVGKPFNSPRGTHRSWRRGRCAVRWAVPGCGPWRAGRTGTGGCRDSAPSCRSAAASTWCLGPAGSASSGCCQSRPWPAGPLSPQPSSPGPWAGSERESSK